MARRNRLRGEDVEGGTAHASRVERGDERVGVDEVAAGQVHE